MQSDRSKVAVTGPCPVPSSMQQLLDFRVSQQGVTPSDEESPHIFLFDATKYGFVSKSSSPRFEKIRRSSDEAQCVFCPNLRFQTAPAKNPTLIPSTLFSSEERKVLITYPHRSVHPVREGRHGAAKPAKSAWCGSP